MRGCLGGDVEPGGFQGPEQAGMVWVLDVSQDRAGWS